ncbi:uncharacterized protein [Pyxicephalus adspersus]|uniref:uncharacterized protein isoform X2 n=1 Tax=Pyxicephalus adspersus TaxID=30357 RepID=UPI003B5B7B89
MAAVEEPEAGTDEREEEGLLCRESPRRRSGSSAARGGTCGMMESVWIPRSAGRRAGQLLEDAAGCVRASSRGSAAGQHRVEEGALLVSARQGEAAQRRIEETAGVASGFPILGGPEVPEQEAEEDLLEGELAAVGAVPAAVARGGAARCPVPSGTVEDPLGIVACMIRRSVVPSVLFGSSGTPM